MAWRPQLSFYDLRVDILRAFDSNHSLLKFTMPDDSIEALVANVGFVRMAPDGLRVTITSPRFDEQAVTQVLEIMLGKSDISTSHLTCNVQHLIPIAADYDEARTSAISGWLRPTPIQMTDIAILVDGVDDETGYGFQCEYGIISAEESVDRLARQVGRLTNSSDLPLDPDIAGLPDVAAFLDWHWSYRNDVPMPLLTTALNFRNTCLAVTERNSAILHTRCLPNSITMEAL